MKIEFMGRIQFGLVTNMTRLHDMDLRWSVFQFLHASVALAFYGDGRGVVFIWVGKGRRIVVSRLSSSIYAQ